MGSWKRRQKATELLVATLAGLGLICFFLPPLAWATAAMEKWPHHSLVFSLWSFSLQYFFFDLAAKHCCTVALHQLFYRLWRETKLLLLLLPLKSCVSLLFFLCFLVAFSFCFPLIIFTFLAAFSPSLHSFLLVTRHRHHLSNLRFSCICISTTTTAASLSLFSRLGHRHLCLSGKLWDSADR